MDFHTYLVRNIPKPLWQRIQAEAERQGKTPAQMMVRATSQYVSGCEAQSSDEPQILISKTA